MRELQHEVVTRGVVATISGTTVWRWLAADGDLAALEAALLGFQSRYEAAARPFEWTFTREDLTVLLTRLALAEERPAA